MKISGELLVADTSVNLFTAVSRPQQVPFVDNSQADNYAVPSDELAKGLAGKRANPITGELINVDPMTVIDDKGNRLIYNHKSVLLKKISFSPDGKIESEITYGKRETPMLQTDYDKNGKVCNLLNYKDGKLISEKSFVEGGIDKKSKAPSANCNYIKTINYYPNGIAQSIEIDRAEKKGTIHRTTTFYDKKGQVTQSVEYTEKPGVKAFVVDNVISGETLEMKRFKTVSDYKKGEPNIVKYFEINTFNKVLLKDEEDLKTGKRVHYSYTENGNLKSKIELDPHDRFRKQYNAHFDKKGEVHWKYFGEVN